jgi:hypothetical protein
MLLMVLFSVQVLFVIEHIYFGVELLVVVGLKESLLALY